MLVPFLELENCFQFVRESANSPTHTPTEFPVFPATLQQQQQQQQHELAKRFTTTASSCPGARASNHLSAARFHPYALPRHSAGLGLAHSLGQQQLVSLVAGQHALAAAAALAAAQQHYQDQAHQQARHLSAGACNQSSLSVVPTLDVAHQQQQQQQHRGLLAALAACLGGPDEVGQLEAAKQAQTGHHCPGGPACLCALGRPNGAPPLYLRSPAGPTNQKLAGEWRDKSVAQEAQEAPTVSRGAQSGAQVQRPAR